MTRLSKAIVTAVLMALILAVGGHEQKVMKKRDDFTVTTENMDYGWFCNNNPFASYFSFCTTATAPPTTSSILTATIPSTTTQEIDFLQDSSSSSSFQLETSTIVDSGSSSSSLSPLESAHWCSFTNGTYIPLGYTFMYTPCTVCQCLQSHAIRCSTLACMSTYCIDSSKPSVRDGQCCSQCAYDPAPVSCVHNGVTFPQGAIVTSTTSNLRCWCQLGNIECRQSTASFFSSLDLWGSGTAIYVIIVVMVIILLLGTVLCCGCTLLYYYYYRSNQQTSQEAYEQYWNTAGWQPMSEDGHVVDANAEEKQAEAEQNKFEYEYPTGNSEYIPPPYALYNGSYVVEENVQDQKHA